MAHSGDCASISVSPILLIPMSAEKTVWFLPDLLVMIQPVHPDTSVWRRRTGAGSAGPATILCQRVSAIACEHGTSAAARAVPPFPATGNHHRRPAPVSLPARSSLPVLISVVAVSPLPVPSALFPPVPHRCPVMPAVPSPNQEFAERLLLRFSCCRSMGGSTTSSPDS